MYKLGKKKKVLNGACYIMKVFILCGMQTKHGSGCNDPKLLLMLVWKNWHHFMVSSVSFIQLSCLLTCVGLWVTNVYFILILFPLQMLFC